jgi:integrase
MGIIGSGTTKPAKALTNRVIGTLTPEGGPYRVPDTRCVGLAVRVGTDGRQTWDLSFRIKGGKVRRVSLGTVTDTPLDKARERANILTRAARLGRDLLAEEEDFRRQQARRVSVASLIEDYCRRRVRGKLRSAREIESRLKRALAPVLDMPAEGVRRRDLRELFDAALDEGHPREAEKRRQTVGAMFRWALGQDFVESDPTAGLHSYDTGEPRDRVLTADECRALWEWLPTSGAPLDHQDVIRLQLLTGARCGEVGGMRAEEIDRGNWVWTLPAGRSKNGKPRATPLVGLAREIVDARLPDRGALFRTDTDKPLGATHVGNAIASRRRALPVAKFTTHDLRRTVASGMAELGISLDLIAAVIGHEAGARGTKTLVRHYVKTDLIDRKATALAAWDARLCAVISGAGEGDNVIRLASGVGL